MEEKRCGIVILNYNSHDLTIKLANKAAGFTSVHKVCVIDNCSNDNFNDEFTHSKIHYIKNKKNTGYSAGNNVGLRYLVEECGCDYVFIANPDVLFENQTIEAMVDAFQKDKKLALIATKRFGPEHAILHQYFDFPSLTTSVKNCFFLTRRAFEKKRHKEQNERIDKANGIVYVDAVPGAFFGIKSEFLKRNNYLYEGIFLYGEEIILGRQAHNLGYRAGIINTSIYVHDHKQKRFSNRKMFYLDRLSLKKYYRLFDNYNSFQWFVLNLAIALGTFEYNCMYYLYHFIKK